MNDDNETDMSNGDFLRRSPDRRLRRMDVPRSDSGALHIGARDPADYTQEDIDLLISCPKEIVDPPKRQMHLSNGHLRNAFRLTSQDREYEFSVFIRINEDFEENFSIGLNYLPSEGRGGILLYRCNGPHGPHESFDHHVSPHYHVFRPEDVAAGLRPGKAASITDEFVTYQDALTHFIRKCNIRDAARYFTTQSQRPMFPQ